MAEIKRLMQEKDRSWLEYPDGHFRKKKISAWVIELFFGTERGGMIKIWKRGKSTLAHVWPPSDDNRYHLQDEVHFMDWHSAVHEFKQLKTVYDILDLLSRNQ